MNKKIKIIFLTLLIYGTPVLLFSVLPFFNNFFGDFKPFIFNFLIYKETIYSTLGIIFDFLLLYCVFLLFKKEIIIEKERTYLIWAGFKKVFNFIFIRRLKNELAMSKEEKNSLLFYFVKLFFTPVMINFAIENISSLVNILSGAGLLEITKDSILSFYFPLVFYLILVADTLIFAFGYIFESPLLKNVVKSVEPTAFGWLVAIICYPPFNELTGKIFGWYSSDFSNFGNVNINIGAGLLSLLFLAVYLWASVALGFKASNLTNRGIVSKGPYKYVRHPAYISKNLSWWIMAIPSIKIYGFIAIFSLTGWSFIYFLRALTEERHLMKDEDYIVYMKKVKYMFIPGIF